MQSSAIYRKNKGMLITSCNEGTTTRRIYQIRINGPRFNRSGFVICLARKRRCLEKMSEAWDIIRKIKNQNYNMRKEQGLFYL